MQISSNNSSEYCYSFSRENRQRLGQVSKSLTNCEYQLANFGRAPGNGSFDGGDEKADRPPGAG